MFPKFVVDPKTGEISGNEFHELPNDKYIKYQVSGKIDYDTNEVKFTESFPEMPSRKPCEFTGKFDKFRFMIEGEMNDGTTGELNPFVLVLTTNDKTKSKIRLKLS